ncbi:hypothetical protein DDZ13_15035 [Coraliomargarita sinensis]|uniref:Uncharacterized protein n=1 Tax=Coraliomargarita sinensis TaxID=2174842 RepID=A0A317ZCX3_9BACT|nr:hypothetical protein [Coraliomargarita sinensis]PXA02840.1 hypothetical protein DDZ13_15035 [Coraliomargarita sinensis]
MKTFRWTIPTPSLSGVEKREHRLYERKKGIKAQGSKYDTIEVEPLDWRERWALYKLNKNRTLWPVIWVVPYVGFLTFIWHDHEDLQPALILLWVIAFLVVEDCIESMGIRSVIARLNPKVSDQDDADNPCNPPQNSKNQQDD